MFLLLDRDRLRQDAALQCMTLLVTGIYHLHCKAKRGELALPTEEAVRRAIAQAVREAAEGHAKALKALGSRWIDETSH